MKSTMRNEREMILADPIICAVLKLEAESIGVSLEQYVARFLDTFYSNPEAFSSILSKQI